MNKLKISKGVKLLFLAAVLIASFAAGVEYFSDAELNHQPAVTQEQLV